MDDSFEYPMKKGGHSRSIFFLTVAVLVAFVLFVSFGITK